MSTTPRDGTRTVVARSPKRARVAPNSGVTAITPDRGRLQNVNRVAPEEGTYELLLHFADGREELKLADHLDRFLHDDTTLMLRGRPWRIVSEEQASMTSAVSRLVCEPR